MVIKLPRPPSLAMLMTITAIILFAIWSRPGSRSLGAFPLSGTSTWLPAQPDGSKLSSIGKISMLYGDLPVYERALQAHEPHNSEHGYEMTVLRQQMLPGFWSKPAYILFRLLEELAKPESERLEWLVWFDVDVIILNYKIPLEIFLPPEDAYPDIHCMVTDDHRGLNNGIFFLRVNDWAVWLMTATLGYRNANCRPAGHLRTQDQGALENIIKEPQFRNNTMHVPQRWFNAFAGDRDKTLLKATKHKANSVKEGDLLVHFAGHKDTREATMLRWFKISEQHLPEWELDLDKTGYVEEIRKFWLEDAEKEWGVKDKEDGEDGDADQDGAKDGKDKEKKDAGNG